MWAACLDEALTKETRGGGCVCAAITQIRGQRYPDRLELYKGNLILVGISYHRTITSDSNITAVRLKKHNGDTEVVMGHWMIELYDDGKNTYVVHEKVRL